MNLQEHIRKVLKEESKLPIFLLRRLNLTEKNVLNLLKKFSLKNLGRNVKWHIVVRHACRDTAYELLDKLNSQISDSEYDSIESTLTDFIVEKYGNLIGEFIRNFLPDDGDELGSRYVFEKHSERYGGSGFSESRETWNGLLKTYASWFPDLNWKELKEKLDGMDSGGKILIKKPGDLNNPYNYFFSLQRFDVR